MFQLLIQSFQETIRSPIWRKNLIASIFLGLLSIYFILIFLSLGFFMDKLLEDLLPSWSVIEGFGIVIIYYLLFDLFLRFMLDKYPVQKVRPYLHLPIKRKTIFHFLLIRTIPSFFNFLPAVLFLPFCFKVIIPTYDITVGLIFIVAILSLILFNNYLVFFIKKHFAIKPVFSLGILVLISIVVYLDYAEIFSIATPLGRLLMTILTNPGLVIIPFLLMLGMYFFLHRYFMGQAYLEDIGTGRGGADVKGYDLHFLDRFGKIGEFIQLEIKLILRNKRPKSYLIMSLIMLLYPVFFLGEANSGLMANIPFLIFLGIFITGVFMMNHGQLIFAWESSYFDFIRTKNIYMKTFIESKYMILCAGTIILFILSTPWYFYDSKMLLINFAACLFNIGINTIIYLYIATYNRKRIEIAKKGGVFNMEGFGAAHFLVGIPVTLLPILIYYPFKILFGWQYGIIAIAIFGVIGIIFRDRMLNFIVSQFELRKYKMSEGFRKN